MQGFGWDSDGSGWSKLGAILSTADTAAAMSSSVAAMASKTGFQFSNRYCSPRRSLRSSSVFGNGMSLELAYALKISHAPRSCKGDHAGGVFLLIFEDL